MVLLLPLLVRADAHALEGADDLTGITTDAATHTVDTTTDIVDDTTDTVGGAVDDTTDTVGGAVDDTTDTVGDTVGDIGEVVGDTVGSAADGTIHATDDISPNVGDGGTLDRGDRREILLLSAETTGEASSYPSVRLLAVERSGFTFALTQDDVRSSSSIGATSSGSVPTGSDGTGLLPGGITPDASGSPISAAIFFFLAGAMLLSYWYEQRRSRGRISLPFVTL